VLLFRAERHHSHAKTTDPSPPTSAKADRNQAHVRDSGS
jgi:hypothetical protein